VSGIAAGLTFNCTIPLFFEMIMETVFGWASENAASTIVTWLNTAVQIVFLAIPTKIGGSAQWQVWSLVVLFLAAIFPLAALRMRYRRIEVEGGGEGGGGGGGDPRSQKEQVVEKCCNVVGCL
jgi:Mn2+/Fe2+ NRAMP family transporter